MSRDSSPASANRYSPYPSSPTSPTSPWSDHHSTSRPTIHHQNTLIPSSQHYHTQPSFPYTSGLPFGESSDTSDGEASSAIIYKNFHCGGEEHESSPRSIDNQIGYSPATTSEFQIMKQNSSKHNWHGGATYEIQYPKQDEGLQEWDFQSGRNRKGVRVKSDRVYRCAVCSTVCSTSGHLARHQRIHTGSKPWQCPLELCQKRFARKDNCLNHFKSHISPKARSKLKITEEEAERLWRSIAPAMSDHLEFDDEPDAFRPARHPSGRARGQSISDVFAQPEDNVQTAPQHLENEVEDGKPFLSSSLFAAQLEYDEAAGEHSEGVRRSSYEATPAVSNPLQAALSGVFKDVEQIPALAENVDRSPTSTLMVPQGSQGLQQHRTRTSDSRSSSRSRHPQELLREYELAVSPTSRSRSGSGSSYESLVDRCQRVSLEGPQALSQSLRVLPGSIEQISLFGAPSPPDSINNSPLPSFNTSPFPAYSPASSSCTSARSPCHSSSDSPPVPHCPSPSSQVFNRTPPSNSSQNVLEMQRAVLFQSSPLITPLATLSLQHVDQRLNELENHTSPKAIPAVSSATTPLASPSPVFPMDAPPQGYSPPFQLLTPPCWEIQYDQHQPQFQTSPYLFELPPSPTIPDYSHSNQVDASPLILSPHPPLSNQGIPSPTGNEQALFAPLKPIYYLPSPPSSSRQQNIFSPSVSSPTSVQFVHPPHDPEG
ncbi:hypothetical protein T439DRAFT_40476 [Meredithblackwellia eburnea MCA 4105]